MLLPDGDPWKEKVTNELQGSTTNQENKRYWVRKANTENFREWLLAPEGAGPFEFGRIFKSFGYPIVVNQRNLPPAVRCMFVCMLLAEPQNNEQIIRTAE